MEDSAIISSFAKELHSMVKTNSHQGDQGQDPPFIASVLFFLRLFVSLGFLWLHLRCVEYLLTQLFTLFPLFFHTLIVFHNNLLVSLIDLLIRLVQIECLFDISHCSLKLSEFVPCNSSFV